MPSGAYDPEDYVRDIESLITSHYPGQKFILMGHSMGGQVAARLAAKRPALIRAVVSVDGSLGFSDKVGSAFAKVAKELQAKDSGKVAAALFKQVYAKTTNPAFKSWHARRAEGMSQIAVRESFGPLFVGPDQVGAGQSSAKFCKGLNMPVYHLCRDPAQAKRMRPWFSNDQSKVDVWTNTGHWIMQDRPDDVNAAVTAWIDAL
jgi:pimeloyl-ACP methyl ester carboxylesterase